jgi:hypothetical protein
MIALKNDYSEKDKRSLEQIAEVYAFKNRKAPYGVVDAQYWLFGEAEDEIPEGYFGDDPGQMFEYQLKGIRAHYANKLLEDDIYMGFLMPWFGTGVLASGFGTRVEMFSKMDPSVTMSDIRHPEEIDELMMPDPEKNGLMPRVLRQIKYFREHCDLPVGITDCQGPLTTAFMIVGYENFSYWMYDHPNKIHKLMGMCTEGLIQWVKAQKAHMNADDSKTGFVLGMRMPAEKGGVWMSDDESVIMPADLYAEFVKPYNEKFLAAFGGGSIHYCGNSNQNLENYMNTKGLTSLHNLHLDDFEGAKKIRKACLENNIVYYLCDFNLADERIPEYYDIVFKDFAPEGLIVASYIAPAIALFKGKYEAITRDRATLVNRIAEIIKDKRKRYYPGF